LAEIVPTFIFGRILPKVVLAAKNIEPSMNATSSRVPTAKSGFGCQKKSKTKFGTIHAKNKNKHDCACHFVPQHVARSYSTDATTQQKIILTSTHHTSIH
jgi:hypothetical protein